MIVVMPEGKSGTFGGSGTEWANAQSGPYENYVLDVVRNVDTRFATIPKRQERGIAGLSEGAFGALNISLHNLRTFSVAESWSGYFNELPSGPFSHEPLSVIRFNSPEQYVQVAAPLIHRLGYRAWIYQGTVDRNPAFHIRDMSQRLHAAGATVHYGFFPGGHDWGLWRAQLPRMLIAASDWFHTNPRATSLLTSIGHQGSPAAIRRQSLLQHAKCLRRRANNIAHGRPPGHSTPARRVRRRPRRPASTRSRRRHRHRGRARRSERRGRASALPAPARSASWDARRWLRPPRSCAVSAPRPRQPRPATRARPGLRRHRRRCGRRAGRAL